MEGCEPFAKRRLEVLSLKRHRRKSDFGFLTTNFLGTPLCNQETVMDSRSRSWALSLGVSPVPSACIQLWVDLYRRTAGRL